MPRFNSLVWLAAGVALSAAAPIYAESELQLNVPYYFFDDIDLDDDVGLGVGYGYRFNNPWGLEITYSEVETELSRSGREVDAEHWQLNGLYHFNEREQLKPFLMLGIGELEFDAGRFDSDTLASTLGVGVKYDLSDNWRLRSDARWFHTDEGSDNLYAVTLGISYVFGGTARAAPTRQPTPEPAPSAPVQTDSDGDGVPDESDRCLDTPSGVPVDRSGCPRDSDGDGVADADDQCPRTRAGLKVDAEGCPVMLEETVSIELEVLFDTASAEVKPDYYPEIRRVAEFLEQYDNTQAVIEGHSDTRGDANYNRQLSQRRADAVRDVLVGAMGVEENRVRAIGYGEDRPLMEGNSADAHEANRRVVAEISTRVERPATE
ncbi:OmpA family protein [Gilvimarinus sp. F26214L]|uniref:OmpA family protein n=1 Tax=Gilvimarinus sp. DZF01 TaxID=3461371 RepID=UPI004045E3EA